MTRLVRSKGLWRDLQVLHEIERGLRSQGKTAVFILLRSKEGCGARARRPYSSCSTEAARRHPCDIQNMEAARVAQEVLNRRPRSDAESDGLLRAGYRLAHNMSWDAVVRRCLLNDLSRISSTPPRVRTYLKASQRFMTIV
ncbi:MAG: hypothetical protein MUC88_26830, partial [Planctomycetes bacterium]|nr:hypothetical protein [Planctomycetota bacterium]